MGNATRGGWKSRHDNPRWASGNNGSRWARALSVLLAIAMLGGVQHAFSAPSTNSTDLIQFDPDTQLASADLSGVPLAKVLEALSEKADLRAVVPESFGKKEIWTTFESLPLDQAIARILKGQSYVLLHKSLQNGKNRIIEIDIIPEGEASGGSRDSLVSFGRSTDDPQADESYLPSATSGDPETEFGYPMGEAEDLAAIIRASTEATDPEDRAIAIQELVTRAAELGGPGAVLPMLEQATRDRDSLVREIALESLDEFDGENPVYIMMQVALNDVDPDIRASAMQIVAARSPQHARDMLKQAANDPDPGVSEFARELLESIDVEND